MFQFALLLLFIYVSLPLIHHLCASLPWLPSSPSSSLFRAFTEQPLLTVHHTLQYSCLENPMDGGAWWAAVHGVAKSQTGLSDFTLIFHFPALEREMATHSSVLAWRIPGAGRGGSLMGCRLGSHRVGHDWSDLAAAAYTLQMLPPMLTKLYCPCIFNEREI